MSLRPATIIAFCLTVIVSGSVLPGATEAQVQILSPSPGATVHGIVQIKATKSQAGEGWITYSVSPSQDKYLAAAMSPFSIKWNTQLYRGGARAYPDGRYTIMATGFDGSGRQQGQASVAVTVANNIKPSEIGATVELKTGYKRGELFDYKIEGNTTVNVPGKAGEELREPPQMGMGMGAGMGMGMGGPGGMSMGPGMMGPGMGGPGGMGMAGGMGQLGFVGLPSHIDIEIDGRWDEDVLSPSATGRAVVDKDLQNGYYTVSWLWPKEAWTEGMEQKEEKNIPDSYAQVLPTAGGEYRFEVFPQGWVEKMHEEQPEFPLGQSFIELPVGPVRVGDTWQGDMAYTPSPTSIEPAIVSATHRLDSFEYRGNHRCARIVSKHTESGATIEIAGLLPWRQEQVGGGAMAGAGMAGSAFAMGAPSLANYRLLQRGMTEAEVVQILGLPTSRDITKELHLRMDRVTSEWVSPLGRGDWSINLTFDHDKLTDMSQTGLEARGAGMPGAGMGPGMAGGPGAMAAMGPPMAGGLAMSPGMPGAGPGMGMGMFGGGLGMGPGGMGSPGGMAGGMALSTYKGDVSVERVSYFSLDAGRIVAFEDTITRRVRKTSVKGEVMRVRSGATETFEQDFDLYLTDVQSIIAGVVGGAATTGGGVGGGMPRAGMMGPGVPGGMPGMGGAGMARPGPGMMGPGMMGPGGMPPGMMGPGGMPPGMMGGGAGMGMMQMQPPTKATLEITTEWYVFDTTAGLSQYAVVSEIGEEAGGAVIKVRPSKAFAHKYALGGAGAASKEGSTFAVDLNAHSFRRVGRYYMPKEHEETVTTTREYLLSLGYIPE